MNQKLRDFIEIYKKKPLPKMTIREFVRSHNHEIWGKCPNCNAFEDLRISYYCPECGCKLDPNFKSK